MTSSQVVSDASFYQHEGSRNAPVAGGWAAWIRVDGVPYDIHAYGSIKFSGLLTSTIAEMCAAVNGAWIAQEAGAKHIVIKSDNLTVVRSIRGNFLSSSKIMHLWYDIRKFAGITARLEAKHVQAHTGRSDQASLINEWCDKHARLGMLAARKNKTLFVMEKHLRTGGLFVG
jgi:ribonuclease HI